MTEHETSLQESPERKAQWLVDARVRIPVGTRVRVRAHDVERFVGKVGTVRGYDVGADGQWPCVVVEIDNAETDGFYHDGNSDDEIEIVAPEATL